MLAPPNGTPLYAAVELRARLAIDKRHRLVTLGDVAIERVQSAAPPAHGEELEAAVRRNLPSLVATLALDRLVAGLASDGARIADGMPGVRNTPPRIVVATRLAVLVPVDGAPVWRHAGDRFDRVLDTRGLVVRDRARRWIYLYVGDAWYRARALAGPWRTAALLPAGLERLRAQLVERGEVDLLDAPGSPLSRALAVGRVPEIVVATEPAELIALDGPPRLAPIPETTLAYVANSDDDLFADRSDNRWYALVSGRWFRARALDGPWELVAPAELPRGFAHIPPAHDKGHVLAAVPGTELAAEALVADELPETATVRRAAATLRVRYDGAPLFAPLAGTVLRWAVNGATPVVEVAAPLAGDGVYYALADGVWFAGGSPDGPWRVAASVPAVIYQIPASAPLHFVTYARVYGGDDEVVRVGYTPGYFGACRGDGGLVVFGTGFAYAPYIGSGWIGRPATYGFGARWEPRLGWTLGADGGSARASFRPWWPPVERLVGGADAAPFAAERAEVYARWGGAVVPTPRRALAVEVAGGGDDLYAGSDGRVYRVRGATWERWAPEGWRPATPSLQASAGATVARDELRALERERNGRRRGARH